MENSFIKFIEKSSESASEVFLFSSFFPFNNLLIDDFFSYFSENRYRKVYSQLNGKKLKVENFNYDELLKIYSLYIENLKSNKIHLVGFGIFSNLFVDLASRYQSKIYSLILFEPDFANSVFLKIFDIKDKPFFKLKSLINDYLRDAVEVFPKKFFIRKKLSMLKFYYFSLKKISPENTILKEIVKTKVKILIFWKMTKKDLWPLPQILSEDYGINTVSIDSNIFDMFLKKNQNMIRVIEKHISINKIL